MQASVSEVKVHDDVREEGEVHEEEGNENGNDDVDEG